MHWNILFKSNLNTIVGLFVIFFSFKISLLVDCSGKTVPYIIFGDFNFRLDAYRLVDVNRNKNKRTFIYLFIYRIVHIG